MRFVPAAGSCHFLFRFYFSLSWQKKRRVINKSCMLLCVVVVEVDKYGSVVVV